MENREAKMKNTSRAAASVSLAMATIGITYICKDGCVAAVCLIIGLIIIWGDVK